MAPSRTGVLVLVGMGHMDALVWGKVNRPVACRARSSRASLRFGEPASKICGIVMRSRILGRDGGCSYAASAHGFVGDLNCARATAVAVAGTLHRAAVLAQKEPSVKMRDEKGTDERSFN